MQLKKTNTPLVARWDKIKSLNVLSDEISARINAAEREDEGITLDIGPELLHTLRHPSSLRCIDSSSSNFGQVFSTHYNKGAVQSFKVWTLQSKEKKGAIKYKAFETNCEITTMTYISKHRVYLVFCMDLTLRVFTDANSNFVEIQCIPCLSTILCLIYNKEDDEIYAGGIGFIEEWRIQGAEHAAIFTPGRKFTTELTRNEWIRDIKEDKHNKQLLAVHGNGICVISTKTRCQIKNLPNRHDGPLKCCCYYNQSDYLVTGGSDGNIKLFHGSVFNLLHVLKGHHGPISSVEPHKTDKLLFSSSHDGTVRIWRMDSLQMTMRLDVGEKIYRLSLLGPTEFFFHTEKNILVYSLNQFYQLFSAVESETKQLLRCQGRDKFSRILASTEDGSVRLFSPVTGLTLTIIYPLPSFQVLMSFAYDLHQDKMHTVLTSGKVLVYDTSTNPCTAKEIWEPAREDERVNVLLLVTVEFMCKDGCLDIDNLVFAGLKNGQIILCEAVVCSLQEAVQAHEGNVVCLNKCQQLTQKNLYLQDTSSMIISGGTDNFVKIWFIEVNTDGLRPVVNLLQLLKIFLVSAPTHISMFGNQLSVVIKTQTEKGVKWRLIMYHMVSTSLEKNDMCNVLNMNSTIPFQLTHSPDDDHSQELTALDVCPIMAVVMTSGKDGFVKIWSSNNQLLREMNFVNPIYACCFANDRGDILVGNELHVCWVSVVKYLPVSYLRKVLCISDLARIKDDKREFPLKFDPKCEPWLDLSKTREYYINIFDRRQQHLEEQIIQRSKREKEAAKKFVIFVDSGKTKVITKDLADKLLTWAKAKNKLSLGKKALTDLTSFSDITKIKKGHKAVAKRSNSKTKDVECDPDSTLNKESKESEYFGSQGLIEIYPSAVGKAIHQLETKRRPLTPYEMRLLSEAELLKKDPIIAPDGYIPNSVIRRKLKPPQVDHLKRVERPFKLKPVPKINPDHMPSWWGIGSEREPTSLVRYRAMKWEDSPSPVSDISSVSTVSIKSLVESPVKRYIGEKSKTTTPLSVTPKEKRGSKTPGKQSRNDKTPIENVKKMIKLNEKYGKKKSGWEDSTSSGKPDTTTGLSQLSSAREDLHRSATDLSESSSRLRSGSKLKPGTPSTTYKSGSAHSCVSSADSVKSRRVELNRVDIEMSTPDSSRRRRTSGGRSVERTKSFKLTNLAVDEDSSMIHIKESKSGRRVKNNLNNGIIQQLLEEKWMPKMKETFEYEDVLDGLIDAVDNEGPVPYDDVCKYLADIFTEIGIPAAQLDQVVGKLGLNLNNMNMAEVKYTLKALQVLGQGRPDVLLSVLPKLLHPEEPIRNAVADTVFVLTGAHDKDTLFNILDEMGITGGIYNSKEDEVLALRTLAERLENREDETQNLERIQSWIQDTTPGLYDEEKEDDSMWTDGTRSRKSTQGKELSFMSDGKSVLDMFENSGLSGLSGRDTMYADLPATPTFSSDDDLMLESREVSMTEGAKSQNSRFKARMDLMDRAGASVLPSDQRIEPPTPISDAENDFYNDRLIEEGQESPIMADPLLTLSNGTRPNSQRSHDMLLGERTLTDMSQVGPLPKFLSNDILRQNVDNISTDSAFESTFSTTEYATSHYSEKFTVSHADQQSSKRSEVSDETNNMFDVEQISILEFEGEGDVDNCMEFDIKSMKMHGLGLTSKNNSMESEDDQDVYPGGISVEITPRDSGRKDSQDTPRSGSTFKKKLQDIDGFSTISDRSSLSRKSKLSANSRTGSKLTHHTHDFDADNEDETLSEPVMSVKIRTPISNMSAQVGEHTQASDAVSLRDILAYNSEDNDSPTPSDRPGTSDKDRDEFTESHQYMHQLTTTDTMDTTTTDPHRETYDNLTIDLMAQRNALYSSEITPGTSLTSPDPKLTAQTLVEEPRQDQSGDIGGASRKSSAGSGKANDEILSLPLKDVPVDPSGSSDSVSPRFTPRDPNIYKYYDRLNPSTGGEKQFVGTPEEDESVDKASGSSELVEKDSDYKSISNVASSQDTMQLENITNMDLRDRETLSKVCQSESIEYSKWEHVSRNSQRESTSRYSKRGSNSKHSRENTSVSRYSRGESVSRYSKGETKSRYSNRSMTSAGTIGSFKSRKTIRSKFSQFSSRTSRTPRTPESEERQLLMDMLPQIRHYYKNKKSEALSKDPLYLCNSEQLVFFPDKGLKITERLSGQDSGIARDMSEFSQGKTGLRKEYGTEKGYMYGAPLSPVKSESSSKGRHSARSLKSPKEWRKFFDELPNAVERRQMEQIKKEMEQGKLKATTLPPISYFADDIPMLPGEAGTRLLQTVKVGEKFPQHDMRHRIESVPGKLAVHTQNENGGLSNFGILQMKWTTGVPTVKDKLSPPRRIPQYRSPAVQSQNSYLVPMQSLNRVKNEFSEGELNLPHLSVRSPTGFNHQSTSHYEWELPLPPPPAKESRTNIAYLKKDHDNYCKYYDLVKKKLHLYTSQKRERSLNLPEVLVKRIREEPAGKSGSPRKIMSPSKTAIGSQLFLPPIKLGQLVKIY